MLRLLDLGGVADEEHREEEEREATPQGYAGGFPVPPMPAGGAVRGAAAPLTFETGRVVTAGQGTTVVEDTEPRQAEEETS